MKTVILLVVLVCVCAHVSELFDTWDHTATTGNDSEFSVVVVALCVGAAFIFVRLLLTLFRSFVSEISPCKIRGTSVSIIEAVPICLSASPPPLRV